MRVINTEELIELYEDPILDDFVVPISVIRQNILDMPILDCIVFPQTIGNIIYYSNI